MQTDEQFSEVKTFLGEDGVGASITERVHAGRSYFSFKVFREHEKSGVTTRSTWFSRRHMPTIRVLLSEVEDWFEALEDRHRARERRAL